MKHIGVVGAGGQMGRGIVLVLLQYLDPPYLIHAVDPQVEGHAKAKDFIRKQIRRFGEKNINALRKSYENERHLVSNEEIIDHYVEQTLDRVSYSTDVGSLDSCTLVFEAIVEDLEEKVALLQRLHLSGEALVLSNTSSIPIEILAERSGLTGKLVGYHFYNPPHLKRVVEVVIPPKAKRWEPVVQNLTGQLKHLPVESGDIAGFIGNGLLIPEVEFALEIVDELSDTMDRKEAISWVDSITEKWLLRPMGIFRLVEFIGERTVVAIGKMMDVDVRGVEGMAFGAKQVSDLYEGEELQLYFQKLFASEDPAADIARRFLLHLRRSASYLVERGVARSLEDVDTILMEGFAHPYGTQNNYY